VINKKLKTLCGKYDNNPIYNKIIKEFINKKDMNFSRSRYPIKYDKFDRAFIVMKAVIIIENWFLECKYNPKYGYCQRLLKKQYDNMY